MDMVPLHCSTARSEKGPPVFERRCIPPDGAVVGPLAVGGFLPASAPYPPDVLVRRRPFGRGATRGSTTSCQARDGSPAGLRGISGPRAGRRSGPGASRAIKCNDLGRMSSHGKAARLHQSSFVNPQCASAATRTTARTSHDRTRRRLAPATSSWSRTASASPPRAPAGAVTKGGPAITLRQPPARAGGRTSSGYRTTTDTPCPRARRWAAGPPSP